jgi:hypothetical protein
VIREQDLRRMFELPEGTHVLAFEVDNRFPQIRVIVANPNLAPVPMGAEARWLFAEYTLRSPEHPYIALRYPELEKPCTDPSEPVLGTALEAAGPGDEVLIAIEGEAS